MCKTENSDNLKLEEKNCDCGCMGLKLHFCEDKSIKDTETLKEKN